jgi:carboxynorspermidine decarboxylase
MVKNTTFNGINLPAIATYDPAAKTATNSGVEIIRRFGYEDYKRRLS